MAQEPDRFTRWRYFSSQAVKRKWTLVGATLGGVAGFVLGGSIGIAAFGSAMNGAIPVALTLGIIGLLLGCHKDRD